MLKNNLQEYRFMLEYFNLIIELNINFRLFLFYFFF